MRNKIILFIFSLFILLLELSSCAHSPTSHRSNHSYRSTRHSNNYRHYRRWHNSSQSHRGSTYFFKPKKHYGARHVRGFSKRHNYSGWYK